MNLNKNKSIEFKIPHTQVAKPSRYHFIAFSKSFEVPDPHDQAVLAICDDRPKWLSRLEIVSARSISRKLELKVIPHHSCLFSCHSTMFDQVPSYLLHDISEKDTKDGNI